MRSHVFNIHMVAVLVSLLNFGAILFLFYFVGAQEFQSLTAEEDADAREDDHIKALFAEVDSNKDGKVLLLLCVDVFMSAPSSLRRCLAPSSNTKQNQNQNQNQNNGAPIHAASVHRLTLMNIWAKMPPALMLLMKKKPPPRLLKIGQKASWLCFLF
jgi:hypothetical protein